MSMIGSEFNPFLEKADDEDCFGFHSEYYVDPEWRKERDGYLRRGYEFRRGYTRYSKYRDDIYFIAECDPENHAVYIIKSNVKQKTSCAIKLNTKRSFDRLRYQNRIVVNRRGYFLYDVQKITLFGFDGREIYTHKFSQPLGKGPSEPKECVYIYDDKVIYSETRRTAASTKIYCVNMLTQEKTLVWGTQKGDSVFDNHLRGSYRQEWGTELPFSQAPSNIGGIDCKFLYANKYRVIAGYTRENVHAEISYIIHVDLAKAEWSILDCFAMPSYRSENGKYPMPAWDDRHIFSFNMLDDTMWVKTNDQDIRLIQTDIQSVAQLKGKYPVGWKLCAFRACDAKSSVEAYYYYFDGKSACVPAQRAEYRIKPNGEAEEINWHPYNNISCDFWCFDDIYLVPNEFQIHCFRNIATGDIEYDELGESGWRLDAMKEMIRNAEQPQPKAAAESKKEEPLGYTEPDSSADDDRAILAMARKFVDDALAADTSGFHYSEAEIESLVQKACELIGQQMHKTTPGDEVLSHKEDGRDVVDGSRLSLAEFRRSAPTMTGFRETLLSYRKSLPNNWDYNAFVGILLGVRGPKHGDAACMNFAIGQGDNGNNTKKTIEAKGLMPVFEKYRGKKIDETILLSDVEDEIIAIAPEYAPIRQRLHEIMKG